MSSLRNYASLCILDSDSSNRLPQPFWRGSQSWMAMESLNNNETKGMDGASFPLTFY